MSNLNELKPIINLNPFARFCCTIGNLPSSYMASLTYEEQLMWFCDYLQNTVIPAVNNNAECVKELQELYVKLKDYVDNYFKNLDVQKEINNKLDEMVLSGELENIIAPYIDKYTSDINKIIDNMNSTITTNNDNINNKINEMNTKINSVTNMSPLVVSSISEMTDTTKMYVLTTDGKWYYYDGNNWVIGGNYQASISSLDVKNTLSISRLLFNNIIPCMNYCDNANMEIGKLYTGDVGSSPGLSSYDDYCTIPSFPIKANVMYRLNNYLPAIPFSFVTDNSGVIINKLNYDSSDYHNFSSPVDGWAYITLQSVLEPYQIDKTMIQILSNQHSDFIDFNNIYDFLILNNSFVDLTKKINSLSNVPSYNNLYVGPTRFFKTIKDALNSFSDSSESNIYNIFIDDGTYLEKNLTLPGFVNLIGTSGNYSACIIRGYNEPNSDDNTIARTSTINITSSNTFKNITITAQNMRYPVHSESNGDIKNWTQIVDNCFIEHLGNQEVINYRIENNLDYDNVWPSCHAWGEGSSSGANLIMENCIIKSVETPFYVHAAPNMEKNYYHKLKNCRLITTDLNSIFIDDTTSPLNNNTLIVENCFLNGRIAIVGTKKYNMLISGSGLKPIYQKPERVLDDSDFPIFTDYLQQFIAGEDIPKGTFVYTIDGLTLLKANSTTPLNQILGYTIGNHTSGELVKVMKGFMQPLSQKWPEEPIESGNKLSLDDNGKIKISTSINDIIIGITQNRWYKLFI